MWQLLWLVGVLLLVVGLLAGPKWLVLVGAVILGSTKVGRGLFPMTDPYSSGRYAHRCLGEALAGIVFWVVAPSLRGLGYWLGIRPLFVAAASVAVVALLFGVLYSTEILK